MTFSLALQILTQVRRFERHKKPGKACSCNAIVGTFRARATSLSCEQSIGALSYSSLTDSGVKAGEGEGKVSHAALLPFSDPQVIAQAK